MTKKSSKDAVFGEIARSIPKHLANNLTKEKIDTSEEDLARAALSSRHIPEEKKEKLKRAVDAGLLLRTETVENEDVIAEIDRHNTRAVAEAIRTGKLPDPNDDPYVKARNVRIANRGTSPTRFQSLMAALKPLGRGTVTGSRVLAYPEPEDPNALVSPSGLIGIRQNSGFEKFRVLRVGPKVRTIKEGQVIIVKPDTFGYHEINGGTYAIGEASEVLAILI